MKLQLALLGLLSTIAVADIVTTPSNAEDMVTALLAQNQYLQLVPGTATLTGHPDCAGIFVGGKSAIPDDTMYGVINFPDGGVAISSGDPKSLHVQSSDRVSTIMDTAGDADLDALINGETIDACSLEFEFACATSPCDVSFEYIWGSEEYTEYVGSEFNDAFALFINGNNVALVPGTSDPVSIDTINNDMNPALFIDNDVTNFDPVPFPLMEADGFTRPLMAEASVIGGTSGTPGINKAKFVVADRSDRMLDSWAIFAEKSFMVKPPPSGGGGGDPHFKRWGYDHRESFHGECDLVVLHSEKFHGAGLDFHVRTTLFDDLYSYIESAALRVGDDILEVHNGHIMLNGAKYSEDMMPLKFGGNKYEFSVVKTEQRANGDIRRRVYRLDLEDASGIEFKFYEHMMTFNIVGHPDFVDGSGMLGAYPSGEMLSRTGKPMDDFVQFGFEWQVNPDDAMLFSDNRLPQLPYERCRMPSRSAQSSRRRLRGNTKLVESARTACSGVVGKDFELCVDDVVMTGDVELANEW